jgi:hypothetical protein
VHAWYEWLRDVHGHLSDSSIRHALRDFRAACGHMKAIGAGGDVPTFPRVGVVKTGPKPKPAEELKSARLGLRLLPEELERIRAAARGARAEVSEFIRREALRAAAAILGTDQERTRGPANPRTASPNEET